jgi:formylglycine-generating enzyme required for sulfatase activity
MSSAVIGQTLLNQFRVDAFIASGGMGAVYRVWDLKRNVPLAMKVLHADLSEDPTMFKRFKREANALKKLAHPNIVPFYGLYETGDFAFLLERYVDGPSLKEILHKRQGKPMTIAEAMVYLKALSAALGYAHAYGVVHCDVKPGNVMVDRGGNIYLTDFGIARHSDSTTTTLATVGTAAYMAPEQIRGEVVSPATDVYALGVMLFEMLTGQRPFRGDEKGTESGGSTANERIRYAHLTNAPPDPRIYNNALSSATADVILKALAKNPCQRYPETRDLFFAACEAGEYATEGISDRLAPSVKADGETKFSGGAETKAKERRITGVPIILVGIGIILILTVMAMKFTNLGIFNLKQAPDDADQTALAYKAETLGAGQSATTAQYNGTITPTPQSSPTPTFTPIPPPTSTPTVASPTEGMVFIPAGEFLMGSTNPQIALAMERCPSCDFKDERPQHTVYLDEYWIDKTEVTNGQYARCVSAGVCSPPQSNSSTTRSYYYGNPDYIDFPVIQVNWYHANTFCTWAGKRLPTEAEWEKAARGTQGQTYPWGENIDCAKANYINGNNNCVGDVSEVGSYPIGVSVYGAFDMAGNVWEWVADWYDYWYYSKSPTNNPSGPTKGDGRVLRGGAWNYDAVNARAASRHWAFPDNLSASVGFRCALSP